MRVPTIAWWPGQIPAGTSTEAITGMIDVLPTLAALAGAKLPSARLDGMDLWPVLSGAEGAKGHQTFHYFRGLTLEAVRSGPWKLSFFAKGKQGGQAQALYNLESDIGERKDVQAENPEVVARLSALADEMDKDLGKSAIGPGCRELGRVANPQPIISMDGKVRAGF
jgi:arylsulfatase A-like enzyme